MSTLTRFHPPAGMRSALSGEPAGGSRLAHDYCPRFPVCADAMAIGADDVTLRDLRPQLSPREIDHMRHNTQFGRGITVIQVHAARRKHAAAVHARPILNTAQILAFLSTKPLLTSPIRQ